MNRLWNKNFTILTLGSIISAFGNAAAGISFGILIFTKTGSPLTLALFTVANIVPRLITNFVAGPFVDRHSRKRIIVALDYLVAVLFTAVGLILLTGYFEVLIFTIIAAFFGIIDTVYQIAFMSLFPEVVTPGEHSRAYSISSLIWPISAAVMAPIAAFFIETFEFGVAYLLLFNAATFFVTATIETNINVVEKLNVLKAKGPHFVRDLKEGLHYYKHEKGILGIGFLFAAFSFVYAASDLLRMPFFVNHEFYTIQHFSYLISAGAIGRVIGGIVHYLFKYPAPKKFLIAVCVYFTVEILAATMLFMPYALMVGFSFLIGLLSVTSFNIRMTATQTYIPSEIRGRVNSTQQLLWNFGAIVGAISIGLLAEYSGLEYRVIVLLAASVSLSAIFLFPIRLRSEFKKIYNVEV
jgi:MFS transporter, DHA3 family, macrolide efflux protein